jgi:hypothetical protein
MVGKFVAHLKKMLRGGFKTLISRLPNFARACGRVSVGGYPDKRPDSRQGNGTQHLSQGMRRLKGLIDLQP